MQDRERGGKKRDGERCWKSGGGRGRLYTGGRVGLADEVGCKAMPDAAGGEGGHGVARPDGVIHRYVFNRRKSRWLRFDIAHWAIYE
jgi:hypothetical protein